MSWGRYLLVYVPLDPINPHTLQPSTYDSRPLNWRNTQLNIFSRKSFTAVILYCPGKCSNINQGKPQSGAELISHTGGGGVVASLFSAGIYIACTCCMKTGLSRGHFSHMGVVASLHHVHSSRKYIFLILYDLSRAFLFGLSGNPISMMPDLI